MKIFQTLSQKYLKYAVNINAILIKMKIDVSASVDYFNFNDISDDFQDIIINSGSDSLKGLIDENQQQC